MQVFPWASLLSWYKENGRHNLPWRIYQGGEVSNEQTLLYRVWISEIFLQQTQVSRVIGYFDRVMERFESIDSLAHTDYETFFPYYQGLGYYSRARNILKTAKIISQEYNGVFPKQKNLLEKLPGVGPYTANALLAFGYGEPYLAWDTNLEKVFSRFYKGRKDIKLTLEEKENIENDFRHFSIHHCEEGIGISNRGTHHQSSSSIENWIGSDTLAMTVRAINNALMDFAATVDMKNSESIDWENYPIRTGLFFETQGSLEPKEEKKSTTFPTPDATIIVHLHEDHKVYFSENPINYSPFSLPPSLHRNTRKYVQDTFREKYGLELSVRPAHKKWLSEDGKPYIEVNAQIQVGVPEFEIYERNRGNFANLSRKG